MERRQEFVRKVSTALFVKRPGTNGDFSIMLPKHTNLINHQLYFTASEAAPGGSWNIQIIPDTASRLPNSVDLGYTVSYGENDSALLTFTGVIAGLHFRVNAPFRSGVTVSAVLSSFSRIRPYGSREERFDYISTTLVENKSTSALADFSLQTLNHADMAYHQIMFVLDELSEEGEYEVRVVPDVDEDLECSVWVRKNVTFMTTGGRKSFVHFFGGIFRGIHLKMIQPIENGRRLTAVLSSSSERFDQVLTTLISTSPPGPGGEISEHINDKNNPHDTSWDNLLNKPTGLVSWRGEWQPLHYERGSMVWDRPFTMLANVDTCDRAAPQLVGEVMNPIGASLSFAEFDDGGEVEFGDGSIIEFSGGEEWEIASETAVVWAGNRYTFIDSGIVETIRIWPPVLAGTTHRLVLVITPPGMIPRYESYELSGLVEGEWNDIDISSLMVRGGDELLVYLEAAVISSTATHIGGLIYEGPNCAGTPPIDGNWNQTANVILRVSSFSGTAPMEVELGSIVPLEVELGSLVTMEIDVGIGSVLSAMLPGSRIRFADAGDDAKYIEYRIIEIVAETSTYVEYRVEPIDVGQDGPTAGVNSSILVEIDTAGSASYVRSADNWDGQQPSYLTVEGFLAFDGEEQVISSDDAHGTDIYFQKAVWSRSWDVVHMPT